MLCMHWKSLHSSVSLQPFFSSIIRYILQRLVCLYLLQSTSIFIWFIGKRICSRSISSMVQCLQNKMMHFNILIKFPINSYLSKAWNLYGREWKKKSTKVLCNIGFFENGNGIVCILERLKRTKTLSLSLEQTVLVFRVWHRGKKRTTQRNLWLTDIGAHFKSLFKWEERTRETYLQCSFSVEAIFPWDQT